MTITVLWKEEAVKWPYVSDSRLCSDSLEAAESDNDKTILSRHSLE